MEIEIFYTTVSKWKENSYLLKFKNQAWLIDPGDEFKKLDRNFNAADLELNGIINTHGHFDHVGAVDNFKRKYGVPFFIHAKDKQILRQANLYKKLAGSSDFFDIPIIDSFIEANSVFRIGNKTILTHYTPGHTNGSVIFEIEKSLFTGDLLFKDTIGRVDLPGGNFDLLKQSVHFVLDNFIGFMIYPGHGLPFLLNNDVVNNLKKMI